jgi:uncharacterized LabA/DUF88 family protein
MRKPLENYAFIDSQNLNLGIKDQGWELDFHRFRIYLKEKYGVTKAYLFLGYLPENEKLYKTLKRYGYELVFKPVIRSRKRDVKGNIDAELVLQAMIDYRKYTKAVIVTGDGDFYCLVKYLKAQGKLLRLLVPNRYKYSTLLRQGMLPGLPIVFVNDLRKLLEYKKQHP